MESEELFYLIVANLIDEKNYNDVLKFLNISKRLNYLIEHKVLTNENLYKNKMIGSLPLSKVKEFIDLFIIEITDALNNCQWFSISKKQKTKIEKELYEFLIPKLTNENIIFYKGVGFKIFDNQDEIISKTQIDRIVKELLQIVNKHITIECIIGNWKKDYIKTIGNNLYNLLNGYKNYQSLKRINNSSNMSYSSSSLGRFRYGF